MIDITVDIETIPDQTPGALEQYLANASENFSAPSTLTKEQAAIDLGMTNKDEIKFTSKDAMIARWVEHFREQKAHEAAEHEWRKTALNGSKGEIVVIGYAVNSEPAKSLQRVDLTQAGEVDLLQRFFNNIRQDIARNNSHQAGVRLIGHNIEAFDMRFMFQRSVIRNVRPTINLNMSRYSDNLFDTMTTWAGFQGRISLDALCHALGIPSPKNGIDGSKVWDAVRDGHIDDVATYCAADVTATRAAFLRMTFAYESMAKQEAA